MRVLLRAFAVMFAVGVALLAIFDADARAARSRGPERVGNMKRIIVPEKGEPQTVIAPNGRTASPRAANTPSSNPRLPEISNPTTPQLRIRSLIERSMEKGRPVVPSPLQ